MGGIGTWLGELLEGARRRGRRCGPWWPDHGLAGLVFPPLAAKGETLRFLFDFRFFLHAVDRGGVRVGGVEVR